MNRENHYKYTKKSLDDMDIIAFWISNARKLHIEIQKAAFDCQNGQIVSITLFTKTIESHDHNQIIEKLVAMINRILDVLAPEKNGWLQIDNNSYKRGNNSFGIREKFSRDSNGMYAAFDFH